MKDNDPSGLFGLVDHKLVAAAAWDTSLVGLGQLAVVDNSPSAQEFVEPCLVLEPFAFAVVVERTPLVVELSFVVAVDLFVVVAFDSSLVLVGSYS